jgi:predicted Zn-dependent peptidase
MGLAPTHSYHRLSNGARLLAAELPDRASVSIVLMFGVGSRFEPERLGGISHFIEHLLFKGAARYPSAKVIAEAIEGVGGVLNAWTDKELTAYWARVPVERFELAADVLFDVVAESLLALEEVERERMVILEELKMYLDQPQDYVSSLFERAMWPDHSLGRDIIGTVESVSRITRDELAAHLANYYSLPNLVMGVSGGVRAEQAIEVAERGLGLPNGKSPVEAEIEPGPLDEPGVVLLAKETEQAHICLGTRALSNYDADRYALDLLSTVLGEGMSSRLFLEIRERRSLAYDVHSYTSKHRDSGYFASYLGVDPGKADEALEAVMTELRRVVEEPVPEVELVKAKEYSKGRLRLSMESTSALASWLCQQQLTTGEVKSVDEEAGEIEAVTAEDLQRVAHRVLTGPFRLAAIGPFTTDAPFRSAIGA